MFESVKLLLEMCQKVFKIGFILLCASWISLTVYVVTQFMVSRCIYIYAKYSPWCGPMGRNVLIICTETEMSSFWRNFRHWRHWKLSFWQLSVQPVMKISSKWWHFRFCVVPWLNHQTTNIRHRVFLVEVIAVQTLTSSFLIVTATHKYGNWSLLVQVMAC